MTKYHDVNQAIEEAKKRVEEKRKQFAANTQSATIKRNIVRTLNQSGKS